MKSKFKLFDLFIVVVVLLLIAGLVVKFGVLKDKSGSESSVSTVPVTYTVCLYSARQYSIDMLEVGDELYQGNADIDMGTITDIEVKPAEVSVSMEDGTISRGTYEDHYDVYITLQVNAVPNGDGYRAGTYDLKVNKSDVYHNKYSYLTCTILEIEETAA